MFSKENIYKLFNEKNCFQRYVLRRGLFRFFQFFGVSVVANHFYELIPNLNELKKSKYSDSEVKTPPHATGWDFEGIEEGLVNGINQYGGEINEMLGENGMLFTDSSHVYKPDSDVDFQICELYPNLPLNTHLHVHDIYMPYKWPLKNIIDRKWFWNEQDHLYNFLSFNGAFKLELSVFWMAKDSKEVEKALDSVCPKAKRHGFSIYFQRIA